MIFRAFFWALQRLMRIGGADGLGLSANPALNAMAPKRRDEIVLLGWRSLLAGTLAACMAGAVVGILT